MNDKDTIEALLTALEITEAKLTAAARAFFVVGKPAAVREAFAGWREIAEPAREIIAKIRQTTPARPG